MVTFIPPRSRHAWDEYTHLCTALWMAVDDTTGDVDAGCRPGGRRTTRTWTSTVTHRRDALVHIPCAHVDLRRDLRRRPFVHMMHSRDDDDDRFLS